jgi:hypothetical protein
MLCSSCDDSSPKACQFARPPAARGGGAEVLRQSFPISMSLSLNMNAEWCKAASRLSVLRQLNQMFNPYC